MPSSYARVTHSLLVSFSVDVAAATVVEAEAEAGVVATSWSPVGASLAIVWYVLMRSFDRVALLLGHLARHSNGRGGNEAHACSIEQHSGLPSARISCLSLLEGAVATLHGSCSAACVTVVASKPVRQEAEERNDIPAQAIEQQNKHTQVAR